jgi:hypothetical protein
MTNFNGGFYNIQFANPAGQSFTPSLDSLDFVAIYTDGHCLVPFPLTCTDLPTTLQITIFSGIFSGSPLGMSIPLTLPAGFSGPSVVDFSVPVALTPGDLYSFQITVPLGDNWGIGTSDNTYAGGEMILRGQPFNQNDVWFAEGITTTSSTPEPGSMLLLITGLACLKTRIAKMLTRRGCSV